MAAESSRRVRSAGLALSVVLAALPAAAQQALDQRVYDPPAEGRIETTPLPPIGGETDSDTLPQPRFLRAPPDDESDGAAGETARQDPGWERSPDGRFHRAPQGDEQPDGTETAPAPVVPIDPPETDLRAGARLRELDKMTGQTKTFELAVGETRDVDRLRIQLEACRSPEGNDMHGTMAFLKVWDTKYPGETAFSGWMFAESPALSALDHPRYDLWVISCTTSAVATSGSRQ